MELPAKRVNRGLRVVDGIPIVTFDTANPETLTIKFTTATGIFHFQMDWEKADHLRYLMNRALKPEIEPERWAKDWPSS